MSTTRSVTKISSLLKKMQKFTKQRRIHLSYTSIIDDLIIVAYLEIDFNYSFWLLEAGLEAYVCVTIWAIFLYNLDTFSLAKNLLKFTKLKWYHHCCFTWNIEHFDFVWVIWFTEISDSGMN